MPSVAFRSSRSEGADVVVGGLAPQPLEWTLDLAAWRRTACAVVGRDLTRAEWDAYVGTVATHRATCGDAVRRFAQSG